MGWRRCLALLPALLLAGAGPAPPEADATPPDLDPNLDAVFAAADFAGEAWISRGDRIVHAAAYGSRAPGGAAPHRLGATWRWASVSKQITATLAMQLVADGLLSLDEPVSTYLPDFGAPYADRITIADLLGHLSGLAHTDDGPRGEAGWPELYLPGDQTAGDHLDYCAGPADAPPSKAFRYGNCDYVVIGAVLEAVTGEPFARLVADEVAGPAGMMHAALLESSAEDVEGYVGGDREPEFRIDMFGAAGALGGPLLDLWKFDRALMTGALLPDEARARMWQGRPDYGYAALGQWAYEAALSACESPVRLIERRGAIGGVQLRNIIVPERDVVVVMATNRSETDFDFGEVWTGSGLTHDLLTRLLCA
ncbi:hypothetical protein B5C34_00115 [Pacificimonas flava]|uniref:Beta-lactamase-related domain-containing protein n=2 Tax=Pacificimonas TaxID=1960290 RepID=A0A219B2I3_9SPHN|nr:MULTISPECIES: serine hydrolase domain-containing protein [Pacificimonas]MBZ6380048.1 beta-lactamase family protein [Pacificimonas aurantium]OWV32019.1 hypothetical protein B5C34_00115 [Pacificimonas flava]